MGSGKRAVFRLRGDAMIGGGHVVRCLTLADALAGSGWRCGFAGTRDTEIFFGRILGHHGWCRLDAEADDAAAAEELAGATPDGCDLLVIDDYGLDARFEAACRTFAKTILVIDDLANRPHDCDLLLDQNVGRSARDYDRLVPAACRRLVGPGFALLRPQFARLRDKALARRSRDARLDRILVSLGAADPHNATLMVLSALAQARVKAIVDVVIGSAFRFAEEVVDFVRRSGLKAEVHSGTDRMAELMSQADLAIGAGGTSALERCCLGLPTIMIGIADNQIGPASRLDRAGAAQFIGSYDELAPDQVVGAIEKLVGDPSLLQSMSARAARILDGRGSRRVLAAIDAPVASDGVPIWLRPAMMDDTDFIFRWQCDLETRRYFRTPCAPTAGEHVAWMQQRLEDSRTELDIVMHGSDPCGVLRLDRAEDRAEAPCEISILIEPQRKRSGIGLAALRQARALHPEAEFIADVHPDNAASHALFRRAGYRYRDGQYVDAPSRAS